MIGSRPPQLTAQTQAVSCVDAERLPDDIRARQPARLSNHRLQPRPYSLRSFLAAASGRG
jgi:hypothetical protein